MKKKILSLSPLNPAIIKMMLQASGGAVPENIEITDASSFTESAIIEAASSADIILGDYTFNRTITRAIAAASKNVKLIQQPSVGYQHIDIAACAEYGIPVANTAGANTTAVAEHTVMAGLCLLKRIIPAHAATAAGEWKQMEIGASELRGKLWGLVGMGRIGRAVCERLMPFGVRAVYYDLQTLSGAEEARYNAQFMELDNLIKSSDVVSLHCPLTEKTRHCINADRLHMMKQSAVLINVARGEIVDETALAEAIASRKIGGAALDVYSEEPIRSYNPFLNVKNENLILTPHIAGATNEAKAAIIRAAIDNIVNVLEGKNPVSLVGRVAE